MNNIKPWQWGLLAVLSLGVFVTRGPLFKEMVPLPGMTLAAFFVAGIYLRSMWFPAILFLAAAASDQFAVSQGVSDWCITPAYGFLIPTYFTLWFAGRLFDRLSLASWREAGIFASVLFLSVSTAFVISNGSFFLFSGRYDQMTLMEYLPSLAGYFQRYLVTPFYYLVPATLIATVFEKWRRTDITTNKSDEMSTAGSLPLA